jgi:hypothetical protein
MEIQQSGGLERNGYPGQAFSFDEERTESGDQAIRNPEIWGTSTIQYEQLMFQHNRFGNDGADTARADNSGQGNDDMQN